METNHISNSDSNAPACGSCMFLHAFSAHALLCLCTLYKCLENAFTFDNTAPVLTLCQGTMVLVCVSAFDMHSTHGQENMLAKETQLDRDTHRHRHTHTHTDTRTHTHTHTHTDTRTHTHTHAHTHTRTHAHTHTRTHTHTHTHTHRHAQASGSVHEDFQQPTTLEIYSS